MRKLIYWIPMFVIIGCSGGGDDDPKPPEKTNLEKTKSALLGTWEMQNIVVVKETGETSTFTGGCDESSYPIWVQETVGDADFRFQSEVVQVGGQEDGLEGYQIAVCLGGETKVKYNVVEKTTNNFEIHIFNWPNGNLYWTFAIQSTLSDLNSGNMVAKQLNVLPSMTKHNIQSITWTFKKK